MKVKGTRLKSRRRRRFREGSYIVITKGSTQGFLKNYVFKQRMTWDNYF